MPTQAINKIIREQGFITVDHAMELASFKHISSYYKTVKAIGIEGDFITAPEISQLFGEIIAVWCIETWIQLGRPSKFILLELGPGRGLLMRDLLKVISRYQEIFTALEVVFLEINPEFQKLQAKELSRYLSNISWIENLTEIENFNKPTIIIANEFFDALPVKQYIKLQSNYWHEVIIKFNRNYDLEFSYINEPTHNIIKESCKLPYGSIYEISPLSIIHIKFIDQHLKKNRGRLLVVDYGYDILLTKRKENEFKSTLQAIYQHRSVDILSTIGKSDLSAHVDFQTLSEFLKPNCKILTQRQFLIDYGILIRANNLAGKHNENLKKIIASQVNYLINPKYMGNMFKALIGLYN